MHFGSCRFSFDPFFYVFCTSHLNMCIISVKLNKFILLNCDHQLGSHVHLIIEQIDLCFNWLFVNSSLPTWFISFNQSKNYTCLPFFHYVFMQSSLYKCWGVLMWSWACWFVLIQLCTCFFLSQFSKFIFLSLGWFFFNLLSIVFLLWPLFKPLGNFKYRCLFNEISWVGDIIEYSSQGSLMGSL